MQVVLIYFLFFHFHHLIFFIWRRKGQCIYIAEETKSCALFSVFNAVSLFAKNWVLFWAKQFFPAALRIKRIFLFLLYGVLKCYCRTKSVFKNRVRREYQRYLQQTVFLANVFVPFCKLPAYSTPKIQNFAAQKQYNLSLAIAQFQKHTL